MQSFDSLYAKSSGKPLARVQERGKGGPTSDLGAVEPRSIPPQPPPSRQLRRQISSRVEVEREVQRLLIVEGVVELDDKGVRVVARAAFKDRLLGAGVVEFAMSKDVSLVDRFERKEVARLALTNEKHLRGS